MKKHFYIIVSLFVATTVGAQSNYRTHGNTSFNSSENWQVYFENNWFDAENYPDFNSDTIFISSGDTARITQFAELDQLVVDSGAVLINSYSFGEGIDSSFILSDGDGYDLKIMSWGIYIHDMTDKSALPGGEGTIFVAPHGQIQVVRDRSGGFADFYANDENAEFASRMIWSDKAEFHWKTSSIFSTVGRKYFPNADEKTIPVFIYNGSGVYLGSNSSTYINGILEIPENKTMNWHYSGNKFFRNGIRIKGSLNQIEGCGAFILNGEYSELDGNGTISLTNNGLRLGFNNQPDTIRILNDINIVGGIVRISSGATVYSANSAFTGSASIFFDNSTGLMLGHEGGFDDFLKNTGIVKYPSDLMINFIGINPQKTGEAFPVKMESLILTSHSGIILSNDLEISNQLTLQSGIIYTNQHELFINTPDTNSLSVDSVSFIIGGLRRSVSISGEYSFPLGYGNTRQTLKYTMNYLADPEEYTTLLVTYNPEILNFDFIEGVSMKETQVIDLLRCGYWSLYPNRKLNGIDFDLEVIVSLNEQMNFTGDVTHYGLVKRIDSSSMWGTGSQGSDFSASLENNSLTVKGFGFNGFSDLAVAEGANSLPLIFKDFKVQKVKNIVNISWSTTNDKNIISFEIEKALDDGIFKQFYTIDFIGEKVNYSISDYLETSGTCYYRAKVNFSNGVYEYSPVETIYNEAEYLFRFHDNQIYIESDVETFFELIIADFAGNIVLKKKILPYQKIFLSEIVEGRYVVFVNNCVETCIVK